MSFSSTLPPAASTREESRGHPEISPVPEMRAPAKSGELMVSPRRNVCFADGVSARDRPKLNFAHLDEVMSTPAEGGDRLETAEMQIRRLTRSQQKQQEFMGTLLSRLTDHSDQVQDFSRTDSDDSDVCAEDCMHAEGDTETLRGRRRKTKMSLATPEKFPPSRMSLTESVAEWFDGAKNSFPASPGVSPRRAFDKETRKSLRLLLYDREALAVEEDAKVDEDLESDSEDDVSVAPIKKSNVRLIVDMLESRLQVAVGRATQRFQEQQKEELSSVNSRLDDIDSVVASVVATPGVLSNRSSVAVSRRASVCTEMAGSSLRDDEGLDEGLEDRLLSRVSFLEAEILRLTSSVESLASNQNSNDDQLEKRLDVLQTEDDILTFLGAQLEVLTRRVDASDDLARQLEARVVELTERCKEKEREVEEMVGNEVTDSFDFMEASDDLGVQSQSNTIHKSSLKTRPEAQLPFLRSRSRISFADVPEVRGITPTKATTPQQHPVTDDNDEKVLNHSPEPRTSQSTEKRVFSSDFAADLSSRLEALRESHSKAKSKLKVSSSSDESEVWLTSARSSVELSSMDSRAFAVNTPQRLRSLPSSARSSVVVKRKTKKRSLDWFATDAKVFSVATPGPSQWHSVAPSRDDQQDWFEQDDSDELLAVDPSGEAPTSLVQSLFGEDDDATKEKTKATCPVKPKERNSSNRSSVMNVAEDSVISEGRAEPSAEPSPRPRRSFGGVTAMEPLLSAEAEPIPDAGDLDRISRELDGRVSMLATSVQNLSRKVGRQLTSSRNSLDTSGGGELKELGEKRRPGASTDASASNERLHLLEMKIERMAERIESQASILLDKASISSLQAVEEIVKRGRPRKSSLKAEALCSPSGLKPRITFSNLDDAVTVEKPTEYGRTSAPRTSMVWPAGDARVETTLPEELTSQLQNLQLSSGSGSDVADSQLLADAWNFAAKRSSVLRRSRFPTPNFGDEHAAEGWIHRSDAGNTPGEALRRRPLPSSSFETDSEEEGPTQNNECRDAGEFDLATFGNKVYGTSDASLKSRKDEDMSHEVLVRKATAEPEPSAEPSPRRNRNVIRRRSDEEGTTISDVLGVIRQLDDRVFTLSTVVDKHLSLKGSPKATSPRTTLDGSCESFATAPNLVSITSEEVKECSPAGTSRNSWQSLESEIRKIAESQVENQAAIAERFSELEHRIEPPRQVKLQPMLSEGALSSLRIQMPKTLKSKDDSGEPSEANEQDHIRPRLGSVTVTEDNVVEITPRVEADENGLGASRVSCVKLIDDVVEIVPRMGQADDQPRSVKLRISFAAEDDVVEITPIMKVNVSSPVQSPSRGSVTSMRHQFQFEESPSHRSPDGTQSERLIRGRASDFCSSSMPTDWFSVPTSVFAMDSCSSTSSLTGEAESQEVQDPELGAVWERVASVDSRVERQQEDLEKISEEVSSMKAALQPLQGDEPSPRASVPLTAISERGEESPSRLGSATGCSDGNDRSAQEAQWLPLVVELDARLSTLASFVERHFAQEKELHLSSPDTPSPATDSPRNTDPRFASFEARVRKLALSREEDRLLLDVLVQKVSLQLEQLEAIRGARENSSYMTDCSQDSDKWDSGTQALASPPMRSPRDLPTLRSRSSSDNLTSQGRRRKSLYDWFSETSAITPLGAGHRPAIVQESRELCDGSSSPRVSVGRFSIFSNSSQSTDSRRKTSTMRSSARGSVAESLRSFQDLSDQQLTDVIWDTLSDFGSRLDALSDRHQPKLTTTTQLAEDSEADAGNCLPEASVNDKRIDNLLERMQAMEERDRARENHLAALAERLHANIGTLELPSVSTTATAGAAVEGVESAGVAKDRRAADGPVEFEDWNARLKEITDNFASCREEIANRSSASEKRVEELGFLVATLSDSSQVQKEHLTDLSSDIDQLSNQCHPQCRAALTEGLSSLEQLKSEIAYLSQCCQDHFAKFTEELAEERHRGADRLADVDQSLREELGRVFQEHASALETHSDETQEDLESLEATLRSEIEQLSEYYRDQHAKVASELEDERQTTAKRLTLVDGSLRQEIDRVCQEHASTLEHHDAQTKELSTSLGQLTSKMSKSSGLGALCVRLNELTGDLDKCRAEVSDLGHISAKGSEELKHGLAEVANTSQVKREVQATVVSLETKVSGFEAQLGTEIAKVLDHHEEQHAKVVAELAQERQSFADCLADVDASLNERLARASQEHAATLEWHAAQTKEFWSIIRHLSQKIDGSEEIVNNLCAEVTECRTEVVEMSASNATGAEMLGNALTAQLETAVDEMRGGLLLQSKQVEELTSFQSRLGEQQPLVEEAVARLKDLSQSHQELQEKLRDHTEERERDTQHLADVQSCLRQELEKVHRDHASAVEAHVLEAEELQTSVRQLAAGVGESTDLGFRFNELAEGLAVSRQELASRKDAEEFALSVDALRAGLSASQAELTSEIADMEETSREAGAFRLAGVEATLKEELGVHTGSLEKHGAEAKEMSAVSMSQGRHLNELSSNYTQLWTADRLLAESVDALKACFSSSEAVLGLEIADESERCHHQSAKLSEHIAECEAETSRIALNDGSLLQEIGDAKDSIANLEAQLKSEMTKLSDHHRDQHAQLAADCAKERLADTDRLAEMYSSLRQEIDRIYQEHASTPLDTNSGASQADEHDKVMSATSEERDSGAECLMEVYSSLRQEIDRVHDKILLEMAAERLSGADRLTNVQASLRQEIIRFAQEHTAALEAHGDQTQELRTALQEMVSKFDVTAGFAELSGLLNELSDELEQVRADFLSKFIASTNLTEEMGDMIDGLAHSVDDHDEKLNNLVSSRDMYHEDDPWFRESVDAARDCLTSSQELKSEIAQMALQLQDHSHHLANVDASLKQEIGCVAACKEEAQELQDSVRDLACGSDWCGATALLRTTEEPQGRGAGPVSGSLQDLCLSVEQLSRRADEADAVQTKSTAEVERLTRHVQALQAELASCQTEVEEVGMANVEGTENMGRHFFDQLHALASSHHRICQHELSLTAAVGSLKDDMVSSETKLNQLLMEHEKHKAGENLWASVSASLRREISSATDKSLGALQQHSATTQGKFEQLRSEISQLAQQHRDQQEDLRLKHEAARRTDTERLTRVEAALRKDSDSVANDYACRGEVSTRAFETLSGRLDDLSVELTLGRADIVEMRRDIARGSDEFKELSHALQRLCGDEQEQFRPAGEVASSNQEEGRLASEGVGSDNNWLRHQEHLNSSLEEFRERLANLERRCGSAQLAERWHLGSEKTQDADHRIPLDGDSSVGPPDGWIGHVEPGTGEPWAPHVAESDISGMREWQERNQLWMCEFLRQCCQQLQSEELPAMVSEDPGATSEPEVLGDDSGRIVGRAVAARALLVNLVSRTRATEDAIVDLRSSLSSIHQRLHRPLASPRTSPRRMEDVPRDFAVSSLQLSSSLLSTPCTFDEPSPKSSARGDLRLGASSGMDVSSLARRSLSIDSSLSEERGALHACRAPQIDHSPPEEGLHRTLALMDLRLTSMVNEVIAQVEEHGFKLTRMDKVLRDSLQWSEQKVLQPQQLHFAGP